MTLEYAGRPRVIPTIIRSTILNRLFRCFVCDRYGYVLLLRIGNGVRCKMYVLMYVLII